MKKKMLTVILTAAVAMGILAGCGQESGQPAQEEPVKETEQETEDSQAETDSQTESTDAEDAEGVLPETIESTAMYVPIAEDAYIFVDQNTEMIFTVTFPEEIYDIDGNQITKEELEKGNIVKLYGNGIMLESYPGQYPGISKIEVIEKGQASDADKYQSIVDEIYQAPDPAEPPTLDVEYTTDLAVVMGVVNRGGYEWTYMDEDGLSNAVVADGVPVLSWGDELTEINLKEPLDMILHFSKDTEEVQAVRYDAELLGTKEQAKGEAVAVEEKDGELILPQVESGYVYEVTGIWENGRATYGFLTVADAAEATE